MPKAPLPTGYEPDWALFLDRDGVLNRKLHNDYVRSPKSLELLPEVGEALRVCSLRFGRIVVVTNQQGIGKGLMTERHLAQVHHALLQQIEASGGRIDAIFFAPERNGEFPTLRKPAIGMALQAQERFPDIQFKRSIMIGDAVTDMEFGQRLGMFNVFVEDEMSAPSNLKIDWQTPSLGAWVRVAFGEF